MRFESVVVLLTLGLLTGCGEMRPIPSHGGGKRFDEEQRAVSGAIHQTVAGLDFSTLRGKRVQMVIDSIAQDGGGYTLSWPGLQSFGGSASSNNSNGLNRYPNGTVPGWSENEGGNVSGSVNFTAQMSYVTHSFATSTDLNYLRATLEMKARMEGVTLVTTEPEATLFILVDVIGTNRSREDLVVWNRDSLGASCELTYYAIEPKSGHIVLPTTRSAAAATYSEEHYLGANGAASRSLLRKTPRPLLITPTTRPTTQPAIR